MMIPASSLVAPSCLCLNSTPNRGLSARAADILHKEIKDSKTNLCNLTIAIFAPMCYTIIVPRGKANSGAFSEVGHFPQGHQKKVKKPLDKPPKMCYNKDTKEERPLGNKLGS